METEKIFNEITNLPPEAQRQVVDFVASLKERYRQPTDKKQLPKIKLAKETFIGIWKDREDMKDNGMWLRNIRKSEWGESSA